MTDRVNALLVVLDHEMRTDDVEALVQAIHLLRGVSSVALNIADPAAHIAKEQAKALYREKLLDLLRADFTL